ncbi:hypothetical protein FRC10_011991 [Ceratobasidium sp. 414]|nr:hypothetical protein FRC10_011991 [Ceratobasidium sp. 414]
MDSTWINCTLCDMIMASKRAVLDYIPKHEQDVQNWVGDRQYLDLKRGLLNWCHSGPPKTKGTLLHTKMYVVRDLVGVMVDAVIKAAKVNKQLKKPTQLGQDLNWVAKEEVRHLVWKETEHLQQIVPSHYWGRLNTVNPEEMYDLIANKGATVMDFMSWLDIRPRTPRVEVLSSSMSSLSVAEATGGYEAEGWGKWESEEGPEGLQEALRTFIAGDRADIPAEPQPQGQEVD